MDIFTLDREHLAIMKELLPESFQAFVGKQGFFTLGAFEEEALLGILQFITDPRGYAMIVYLYVDPAERRASIGMNLVLAMSHILRESGVTRVHAWIGKDTEKESAERFLFKAGFRPDPSESVFMAPASLKKEDIEKILTFELLP